MPLRPELAVAYRLLERSYFPYGTPLAPWRAYDAYLLEEVARIVDRAIEATGSRPRADARYFLLLNAHQMVVVPISLAAQPELLEDYPRLPGGLLEVLEADLQAVLQDATEREETEELSSGAVLRAFSRLWDGLGLNEVRWWGAD